MSRKTNRLKAQVDRLNSKTDHAEFVASRTLLDNAKLLAKIRLLNKKLNTIASFGSHSLDTQHSLSFNVQIGFREIKLSRDPHGMIDLVFEGMKSDFHRAINRQLSSPSPA